MGTSAMDPADRPEVEPGTASAGGRRKRPSRTQQEMRQKEERVKEAVEAHYAKYRTQVLEGLGWVVGAIYARFSSKKQESVPDQVRKLLEYAAQNNIFVPFENIFYDLAERGYKKGRPGLIRMEAALGQGKFSILLLFATNRFFRDRTQSIEFVENRIVARGLRAVFVTNGIDTANTKQWKRTLQCFAFIDEMVVGLYSDTIRATTEGLLLQGYVYGRIPLGYYGAPVPGTVTRNGKERCRLAVDPETSTWPIRIFDWFVREGLYRADIIRRLNDDESAPKPPSGRWTVKTLTRLLKNARYRGEWSYGATETRWLRDKDYARHYDRSTPLKTAQLDDLRLVSDEFWHRAQVLIAEEKSKRAGRKPKNGAAAGRSRVLHKLFDCPTHDMPLYVGGKNGERLLCKYCLGIDAAKRPLFSFLSWKLALKRLCEFLADRVKADADLVARVVAACQARVAQFQSGDPEAVTRLGAELARINRQIEMVVRNAGDPNADQEQSDRLLKQFRADRQRVTAELAAVKAARERVAAVPTPEQVATEIDRIEQVLLRAATGVQPGETVKVRRIIDLLTGGRIHLEQVGEKRAYAGYLRGRFRLRLVDALSTTFLGLDAATNPDAGEEVSIDFDKDHKRIGPAVRAQVIELYRKDMLVHLIADAVGIHRKSVRTIVVDWHETQGLPVPDAYVRRKQSSVKQSKPTKAQLHAEKVYAMIAAGRTVADITRELGVSDPTVYDAWKHWFQSRGLDPIAILRWRRDRKLGRPVPGEGHGNDGLDMPPESPCAA
jgi:DNA invertase Pin-like site-specific DNA recombinase